MNIAQIAEIQGALKAGLTVNASVELSDIAAVNGRVTAIKTSPGGPVMVFENGIQVWARMVDWSHVSIGRVAVAENTRSQSSSPVQYPLLVSTYSNTSGSLNVSQVQARIGMDAVHAARELRQRHPTRSAPIPLHRSIKSFECPLTLMLALSERQNLGVTVRLFQLEPEPSLLYELRADIWMDTGH